MGSATTQALSVTNAALAAASGIDLTVASELFQRAGMLLGLAVANQVTMLNPGRLIVGGGTLHHVPGLRVALELGVRAHASMVSSQALTIVDAELGDDAGLIGAALLAT